MVGGKDDGSQIRGPLSSVLMLLPEGTSWTPLASLPQALTYVRASIVGDQLWVNGGFNDGSQDEVGLLVRCEFADQKVKYCLGLFIAPKCVKSQNQPPFHTIKCSNEKFSLGKEFLATLVALHLTTVSE